GSTGGFWSSLLPIALQFSGWCGLNNPFDPFPNLCARGANQVANCMATGNCSSTDPRIWQGVVNDPSATAVSISPDNLAGRYNWNATVWSPDYPHQVSWNSPGSVYGCWD